MAKRQTAAEAYETNRHDIILLVDLLKAELDRHAERAAAEPRNWSFAGDLGSVRRRIIEVLASLSGRTEASIEDALARPSLVRSGTVLAYGWTSSPGPSGTTSLAATCATRSHQPFCIPLNPSS